MIDLFNAITDLATSNLLLAAAAAWFPISFFVSKKI